jgi:hypothetical protein
MAISSCYNIYLTEEPDCKYDCELNSDVVIHIEDDVEAPGGID